MWESKCDNVKSVSTLRYESCWDLWFKSIIIRYVLLNEFRYHRMVAIDVLKHHFGRARPGKNIGLRNLV